jgi:hypothetical protein
MGVIFEIDRGTIPRKSSLITQRRGEVPFRERSARTGFQIAFESNRLTLGWKLDRDHDRPWLMRARVAIWAFIVPVQPLVRVARDADVMPRRIRIAAKDVDESSAGSLHAQTIA